MESLACDFPPHIAQFAVDNLFGFLMRIGFQFQWGWVPTNAG